MGDSLQDPTDHFGTSSPQPAVRTLSEYIRSNRLKFEYTERHFLLVIIQKASQNKTQIQIDIRNTKRKWRELNERIQSERYL